MRNVIIIGSGPAGLTAAIYTSRANLQPLVIAGQSFGGQLMNTTDVENYPGFPEGIMGPEMMQKFIKQAERFGSEMMYKDVTKVELSDDSKKVWVGDEMFEAKAVIIATGAEPKKLGLDSEEKYWGKGVSSCATCDGAFYRDKVVSVVGGGDSAAEEALFLTRFASKVYMIVRKDELRASKIMQDRVMENEKIEVLWNREVKEVLGDENVVTGLKLYDNKNDAEKNIELQGMFLGIGHMPKSEIFQGQITSNDNGYLEVVNGTYSNVDGVFIAGDVNDERYRQAVTASGSGCMAAIDAERWLEAQGN
ncbi:thioredoxin-disulfide reductase [Candidatus Dojkabacteria bacterium]|uniref:Thioredoxin reductase n=1 Tax=Candidatus Dojkabacteria bacterium TaxID=2099670 RepID=A0A955L6Q0_9BACT|nr:thioredoxin-disulfide reductase [Candidatus Dojkabacteria bacterium]